MEEDIKELEEFIEDYYLNREIVCVKDIQAIENLIKRNKELEEENKDLRYEIDLCNESEIAQDLAIQDSIPKSKVREKIEFIKSLNEKIYYEENVISILEDLQEGDK